MTPTIAILLILAGALFARQLFAALRIGVWLALAALAFRFISTLDLPSSWWTGAAGGFVLGFLLIGVLLYAFIHNALVDADLRRQIERDKQQAQARRI